MDRDTACGSKLGCEPIAVTGGRYHLVICRNRLRIPRYYVYRYRLERTTNVGGNLYREGDGRVFDHGIQTRTKLPSNLGVRVRGLRPAAEI